jgi:hypothetical protein
MEFAEIEKQLAAPALWQGWQTQADEWTGTDAQGRSQAISYIHGRQSYAIKTLEEIGDPDQLRETLAILYIEIKSQWIMLNTMVNYQLFRKGEADGEAVLRASLLSNFLQAIESLLKPEDIGAITNFLAAPVRQIEESTAAVEVPAAPSKIAA